jgi:pyridoxamine 5'-phosphate oxidase-like protein
MVNVAEVMAKPLARRLLSDVPVLHLAYAGRDGAPRAVPVGYLWDGRSFRFWTIPHAPKIRALEADPRVAVTIDMLGTPSRLLLARGRAVLTVVDGVPAGYLEASHRALPRDAWDGFDAQVRGLYDQMVEIAVTPEWAKLIDFETSVPVALERLVRQRGQG